MAGRGKEIPEAYQTYNAMLAGTIIKQMATIPETNASAVRSVLKKGMDVLTSLRNYFPREEIQKLSDEQFLTLAQELLQMYRGNIADLSAFIKILDNNSKFVSSSTLFADSTFIESAAVVIGTQQELVAKALVNNMNTLLESPENSGF
jgi:hypothetical protein